MEFADQFQDLPLDLLLEGLPISSGLREVCQGLFDDLHSEQPAVAELACLGLHRLAAESMAIALCLKQVATMAERRWEHSATQAQQPG